MTDSVKSRRSPAFFYGTADAAEKETGGAAATAHTAGACSGNTATAAASFAGSSAAETKAGQRCRADGFRTADKNGSTPKSAVVLPGGRQRPDAIGKRIPEIRGLLWSALPFMACAALLVFQEAVRQGVRQGLTLCACTLIPALFPFMVLSDLLPLPASDHAGGAARGFGRLFGLPAASFGIFCMGALCGVPLGARETVRAYRAGEIGREQAERLLSMAGLCGPAFVIAGVGCGMRQNLREGIWLFAIQLLASLLSGWLFSLSMRGRRSGDKRKITVIPFRRPSYTDASQTKSGKNGKNLPGCAQNTAPEEPAHKSSLPGAIRRAATDLLAVCGSVCLFSAFGNLLLQCLPSLPAALLYALAEVTGGASFLASVFSGAPAVSFALSAGAIAFGGMSIHLQTALFLEGTDLRFGRYLLGKAVSGVIALGLGFAVCRFL